MPEGVDGAIMVGVLSVMVVAGMLFAIFGGVFEAEARRAKRMAGIDGRGTEKSTRTLKAKMQANAQSEVARRLKELSEKDQKRKSGVDIRTRMIHAGLTMAPAQFLMIFYVLAVLATAGAFFMGQPWYIAIAAAVVVGLGLPRFVLKKLANRRRIKFLEQFPNGIDILVRGVKSGLPINEGLKLIANEIPDPVRTEFRLLVDTVSVGVSIEDALSRMFDRIPIPEVNFFRTVLVIQKQSGGNLAEALGNLSTILRERKKLKGKIRALSSEARTSAIIIGSLPFVVSFLVYLITPDYIMTLFTDPSGPQLIGIGLFWMSIGVFMMRSMINFDT